MQKLARTKLSFESQPMISVLCQVPEQGVVGVTGTDQPSLASSCIASTTIIGEASVMFHDVCRVIANCYVKYKAAMYGLVGNIGTACSVVLEGNSLQQSIQYLNEISI